MELTIESAFSTGGLIGNASYILLIASMAMRDMFWLRVLAILSGICGIAYDAIWLTDPVGTFWESLFTLINLGQWFWLLYDKRQQSLLPQEQKLKTRLFPELEDIEVKQLLRCAVIKKLKPGEVITYQDKPVSHLYLISRGKVIIDIDGTKVSDCQPGDYIGEISYLNQTTATATSIAETHVELLCFDKSNIAVLIKNSENLGLLINTLISKNLTKKLLYQREYQCIKSAVRKPDVVNPDIHV